MAKFTIIKLRTTNGDGYGLGANGVEKITYLRSGYNSGYQFFGPAYMITYDGADSDIKRIVPETHVTSIDVQKEENSTEPSPEAQVELPE